MSDTTDTVGITDEARVVRRRRWMRYGLIASLALNLFLIGVVGVWLTRPLFRGPPTVGMMIHRTLDRLPEADANALRDSFARHQPEIARQAKVLREARRRMSRELRADPFNPAGFDTVAREAREARGRFDALIHDVYRDAAGQMTPEGRSRLGRGPRPG